MKFLCKCGKTIHDTTDDLFYKGTIIADQDMASMSRSTYRRLTSSIQNISLMIYFNLEAKIFRENLV